MTSYTTITEQRENNIITDWGGVAYNGLREIVEHIKNTELEEELDLDEVLRLALYTWNNHETKPEDLTPERLAEIWAMENDAYAGEFSTEADFAEDLITQTSDQELPSWVVIDWQGTYNYALQFDYYNYEARLIDGGELVMSRYFWRAN
jgi:hypothetical protein